MDSEGKKGDKVKLKIAGIPSPKKIIQERKTIVLMAGERSEYSRSKSVSLALCVADMENWQFKEYSSCISKCCVHMCSCLLLNMHEKT